MATGRKTVTVGQVIDPATWGNPVWDQSVQQFASDADRTAQFPAAQRRPGAVTWLDDLGKLQVWTGTVWQSIPDDTAWTLFTPTITNLVLGNGTTSASYKRFGRVCHYKGRFTVGTTTTYPGGSFLISLPFPNEPAPDDRTPLGVAAVVDSDAQKFYAGIVRSSTDVTKFAINAGPNAYLIHAGEPMTWAPGDSAGWNITYQMASA